MKARSFSITETHDTYRVQHKSLAEEDVIVLKGWPTRNFDLNISEQIGIELKINVCLKIQHFVKYFWN